MNDHDPDIGAEIASLRDTLRLLRGKDGCPWDRERSIDDIISDLINEAYELLRAGKSRSWDDVEEELGDVLFLLLFTHELYLERRSTPLSRIIARVHKKIVNRHPHVFGSRTARNSAESLVEWERVKRDERGVSRDGGVLTGVPPELPPLRRAAAIQRKAAGVGFDWPDTGGIFDKLREEIVELEGAVRDGTRAAVKDEIGDCFFTLVNLARRLQIEPENVLEQSTMKFIDRFRSMENTARARGLVLDALTLDQLEALWRESKGND